MAQAIVPDNILLVAPTFDVAEAAVPCLSAAASRVRVVGDFQAAKAEMALEPPALLVTEVKLGAYNGLHLALCAHNLHVPTIILGDAEPVLEGFAREHGFEYLRMPMEHARLRFLVGRALSENAGQVLETPAIDQPDNVGGWLPSERNRYKTLPSPSPSPGVV